MSDKIDGEAARYMCAVADAIRQVKGGGPWYVTSAIIAIDGEDVYQLTANDAEDYDLSQLPEAAS